MRRIWRENGLSIVMFGLFFVILIGHSFTGFQVYNEGQRAHNEQPVGYAKYLTTGHFIESVFENWESEFLQMGAYVLLTAYLFQRGSAESKDPEEDEPVDADPREAKDDPQAPGPVRRGGWILKVYEYSLSLALFALFFVSFVLHAAGGANAYNQEQATHGGEQVSFLGYLASPLFWFESLQNWQSEFLSVGVLVVLSIFLRQRGSPESKPVAAPHHATGESPSDIKIGAG